MTVLLFGAATSGMAQQSVAAVTKQLVGVWEMIVPDESSTDEGKTQVVYNLTLSSDLCLTLKITIEMTMNINDSGYQNVVNVAYPSTIPGVWIVPDDPTLLRIVMDGTIQTAAPSIRAKSETTEQDRQVLSAVRQTFAEEKNDWYNTIAPLAQLAEDMHICRLTATELWLGDKPDAPEFKFTRK